MQKRNETVFGDIDGVYVIAGDIIVAAKNEKEHDAIVLSLLNRSRRRAFASTGKRYMGHLVAED